MENWDVSEWMQVGIKLPAVLVPQFPLWLRLLPLPWRGLQLLGEVWENFQTRIILSLLFPWHPTSLIPSHPAGDEGTEGSGMVTGLESQPGAALGQAGTRGLEV